MTKSPAGLENDACKAGSSGVGVNKVWGNSLVKLAMVICILWVRSGLKYRMRLASWLLLWMDFFGSLEWGPLVSLLRAHKLEI